jgi:MATE family multidrug resistance protein
MVGRYSTEALASASFVNNLFNVIIFGCVGFTYGLTPLIGALFAQQRYDAIGATLRNGLVLNILFSLLLTAIMGVIYLNLEHLGQPAELLPLIRPYYLLYMAGMLPISLFNVFAQWLYGIKSTQLPMWIVLGSNILNIVGNWALIYGQLGCPRLGLLGAGISTLVARWLCPIAGVIAFLSIRRFHRYRRGFAIARTNMLMLRQVNSTSWPVALQSMFESGSFTIAAVMAGWRGAISLAAYQVIVVMGMLGFCIYYGVGSAIAILVANAAGHSNHTAMRRSAFAGYHIMLLITLAACIIFACGGPYIIRAFTTDDKVIALSLSLIVPLVIYQIADASQVTFANALRGTANVMPMMWIAAVSYLVIGIPATWLLAFPVGLGTYGIVLSFAGSLALAAILYITYFIKTTRP